MTVRSFFVTILLFLFTNIYAQTTISGRVTDEQFRPLKQVTVHLLNTPVTVTSNEAGDFTINDIDAGPYTIRLSAVGYATAAEDINIQAGHSNVFHFRLTPSAQQLEAITVTAQKKEELQQQVPVSITVLSAAQVADARLWNSKELTALVPNLASGHSGDQRNITSIRGITSTSYDPAVATYIDGVNQFGLDTYISQLWDVERIEVLRGPQGTLYGRNAMGGVINILTKQPANTPNGFVELNAGNYNQWRYSMGIRTPLIKDRLFLGAAGSGYHTDGYYRNRYNDTPFDKQKLFTGNVYLKYTSKKSWNVLLNVKQQQQQNNGAFPIVPGADEAFAAPYQLDQNATGKMMDRTWNASLALTHWGRKLHFSTQAAWQNNYRYYKAPLDGDFSPLDAVTIGNDYGHKWNNVKVLTHELKLGSGTDRSSKINWTAGTYFFHQYNPVKQSTHFGKDAGLLGVPDTDFSTISISRGRNTGFALFGQLDRKIAGKLTAFAGLRYDYEHRHLAIRGEYQKDQEAALVTLPDTAASVRSNAVTPRLGLLYPVAKNSQAFANYSRGFRTGGLTQLSSDPSQPPLYPYRPEYSNNIEAGIKNTFLDNRLRLNITFFLSHINDVQVPTLVMPDAITITKNTGALASKGAELEAAFKPVKGLQVDYNLGYTNATYRSLRVAQNGNEVDLAGRKQLFTPDVTSMLALQYSYWIPEKRRIKMTARAEWIYLGEQYFDLSNHIRQAPYSLINARAGISTKQVELFFWMRNAAGKKYIEYAYDFGAVHLGDPQTYGVTLRTQF
ncbi:TonB-dependent receptor [Niabella drilacis]|uniref:Iron complex outermembrane recepter protein n=1 Tax=Niabella drilacis (strain DSM 25811 / CCM 8410 / CCUG 62505 / LMG 26954 / E90) TaxID=1285928 RepID=A0A1G6RLY2_NIADE|nr:TonB-dependent receptor [Niabella drilacis]SDD05441.1 iron complex outermembrane recepter protein [Niabella drilacis]